MEAIRDGSGIRVRISWSDYVQLVESGADNEEWGVQVRDAARNARQVTTTRKRKGSGDTAELETASVAVVTDVNGYDVVVETVSGETDESGETYESDEEILVAAEAKVKAEAQFANGEMASEPAPSRSRARRNASQAATG